jgi:hypothetical protein
MAIGPLPLDEPIPYVLVEQPKPPEPEPPKRVYKKSKSRTFSEPRSKKGQGMMLSERRHLPVTYDACQREIGDSQCPYVSCSHHLYADATLNGVKFHFWEDQKSGAIFGDPGAPETCSLRLANGRHEMTLSEIGAALGGVTDERVRQILKGALEKMAGKISRGALDFMRGAIAKDAPELEPPIEPEPVEETEGDDP